jgi:hypothetical protein
MRASPPTTRGASRRREHRSQGRRIAVTSQSRVEVRVQRRFEAAPERVFDAWLDRAMIGPWMFGNARPSTSLPMAPAPRSL